MTDSQEENEDSEDEPTAEELAEAYSSKECEYEDHVSTAYYYGDKDNYPRMEKLLGDVSHHGEVHATVEGHDRELEIRKGTVAFDFERGLIRVERNMRDHMFPIDRIIDWYEPTDMWADP